MLRKRLLRLVDERSRIKCDDVKEDLRRVYNAHALQIRISCPIVGTIGTEYNKYLVLLKRSHLINHVLVLRLGVLRLQEKPF